MNLEQATSHYEALQDEDKVTLLGRVAFDLTIDVRDVSSSALSEVQRLEKLQGINELQHKLLGQMLAHQNKTTARYGDRDFFRMLVHKAKEQGLLSRLQQSMIQRLKSSSGP